MTEDTLFPMGAARQSCMRADKAGEETAGRKEESAGIDKECCG
jgi:hypothetical protein